MKKTMRVLAMLLTMVILLGLAACGGKSGKDEGLAGYYVATKVSAGDETLEGSAITATFDMLCMVLNADGTGWMAFGSDDVEDVTWEDTSITADGLTVNLTREKNTLTLELEGTTIVYTKSTESVPRKPQVTEADEEPEESTEPEATAGFLGYYTIESVEMFGETPDLKELEMDQTYVVLQEDGTGWMASGLPGEVSDFTWTEGSVIMDGENLTLTLDGDTLTMDMEGSIKYVFNRSGDPAPAKPEKTGEPEESVAPTETVAQPAGDFVPVSGTIDGYEVTVVGAELFKDSDDKDSIRIYYDFTNTGDDFTAAWSELNFTAEQEGFELKTTYAKYGEYSDEDDNDMKDIVPGVTIRCVEEFNCKAAGESITFVVDDWFTEDKIEVTLDPTALPGKPATALEMPTITEATVSAGLASSGIYQDDYEIALESVETYEDSSDGTVARVYFTFTNNSDEAISPWIASSLVVFQDGVELDYSYPYDSNKVDEDDNYNTDVEPGSSIRAADTFVLRSDSPVEVIFKDYFGQSLGAMYPVK